MKKIFFIGFLSILNATFSQETSECFGITPGQEIEIYENAQVGDTIGIIQYCSTGEWKKVEAEYFNTLALKENGQLYTWGTNGGRWGPLIGGVDPSQAIVFDPHLVKDPLNTDIDFLLDDVSASIRMAFGIKSEDKSLWGWGRDEDGSLGIGEDPDAVYPNYVAHRVPQLLNNTNTWEKVSASSYFGNAIDTEGKLWGWGYADSGYYGNGFQEETYTPTQVGTASDWAELSCGSYNTYLIKDDGTLWVMGPNKKGSSGLGDEENTAVSGIVQIGTDSDWSQVASYNLGALAIKTSGQMFVWGENRGGQLGFNPDTTDIIATPTQIPGTESIVFQHADLGRKHGVASGIDGEFYGWGENLSGQLGNGDIGTYEPFGLIETGTVITKFVSAAGRTSGFITEEGSLRMFGSNDTGQLGYGSGAITNPNTPVVVDLGPNLENKNITKYDSSSVTQGVLTDTGELWVWGDNEKGQLGVGHTDRVKENYYPNRVGTTSDVWTDFISNGENLYAAKDNKLYGVGDNEKYNLGLGLGNMENKIAMTEIPGVVMSDINTWQGSWAGVLAIKNNGELWGFGGNWIGQMGIDPNAQINNTRNTIDTNGDGFGGIHQIDNINNGATENNGENSITNGDFENGSDSWLVGVDDASAAPVVTVSNTYYSVEVTSVVNAHEVNTSQKVEIIEGNTYTLTFDAWSDVDRTIIAGIGLSNVPWTNSIESVSISAIKTTYTLTQVANFGASDARVLFDLGAEIGIVNIDNVSLVTDLDNLLTNGDFENGSDSWLVGVDDASAAPVVTVSNTYYSVEVTSVVNAHEVNTSQKVEIIEGNTYTLTFDAWSDVDRTIIAGIGLSNAPWTYSIESVSISAIKTTYTLTQVANFGASDARVLFDLGAEIGLVNIDNVSLINSAARSEGSYEVTSYDTSGVGEGAIFQVDTDVTGTSQVSIIESGNNFEDNELVTILDVNLGNSGGVPLTFNVDGIGDNTGTTSIPSFQKLHPDTDWVQIFDTKSAGITIVEKTDGSIWFTGGNKNDIYSAFGYPNYNNDGFIQAFPPGNDWSTFSNAETNSQATVIGIKDDGTMWSFGSNQNGLAGVGSDQGNIAEITQIGTDTDWQHVNVNGPTALAIKTDHSLWTWGNGWVGQLGNGTFGNANQPTMVSGNIEWETTGGGWAFETGIATDGTIYGWGYNRLGGLGGLGEVSSEYLDWITDLSIIGSAFSFSDLGYVIIQDSDAINYEDFAGTGSKGTSAKENILNLPIEITLAITMSDGINTSSPEDVVFKIINVNEAPTDIEINTLSFDENNAPGFQLSEIIITDPDLNETHTVEIDNTYGDFNKFAVVENYITLSETILYDAYEQLELKLNVTDSGGLIYSETFTITVNAGTLKIDNEELNSTEIELFPNPFHHLLSLNLKNGKAPDNFSFKIFDITGKTIIKGKSNTVLTKINTENLETGLYFIKIHFDDSLYVKRLIKE